MSPEEMAGKMVIGKLHEVEGRPEFSEEVYALMSAGEGGASSEARLCRSDEYRVGAHCVAPEGSHRSPY